MLYLWGRYDFYGNNMDTQRKKVITALKKARSSIDRIIETIECADTKNVCFDVMQQNLAVIGLLKSANVTMLEKHLDQHIHNAHSLSQKEKQKMHVLRNQVVRIVKTAQDK